MEYYHIDSEDIRHLTRRGKLSVCVQLTTLLMEQAKVTTNDIVFNVLTNKSMIQELSESNAYIKTTSEGDDNYKLFFMVNKKNYNYLHKHKDILQKLLLENEALCVYTKKNKSNTIITSSKWECAADTLDFSFIRKTVIGDPT